MELSGPAQLLVVRRYSHVRGGRCRGPSVRTQGRGSGVQGRGTGEEERRRWSSNEACKLSKEAVRQGVCCHHARPALLSWERGKHGPLTTAPPRIAEGERQSPTREHAPILRAADLNTTREQRHGRHWQGLAPHTHHTRGCNRTLHASEELSTIHFERDSWSAGVGVNTTSGEARNAIHYMWQRQCYKSKQTALLR